MIAELVAGARGLGTFNRLDRHHTPSSEDKRNSSPLRRNILRKPGDRRLKVGFPPLLLSFFRNISRSPRKRASMARVLEKSIVIGFLVAIASLKAEIALSICPVVA